MGVSTYRKFVFFLSILLLSSFLCSLGYSSELSSKGPNPFVVSWDKDPVSLTAGTTFKMAVKISAPPGHYIYKDKTYLDFMALEGVRVLEIKYPSPTTHKDAFSGKTVAVFEGDIIIDVIFSVPETLTPGEKVIEGLLVYQGCSQELCFREMNLPIEWKIKVTKYIEGVGGEVPGRPSFKELLSSSSFGTVLQYGYLWAFIIAFLGGILTSLTPCVLPIIPVTLLVIGVHKKGSLTKNLLYSFLFTLGITFTYSILGIVAASLGFNLGFLFQERAFLILVVLFFIAMSLSMFGFFTIQLPLTMRTWLGNLGGRGFLGSFLAGISVGLLAAPCVGPVIGPILLYVASTKSLNLGFWLLATYSMGMGLLIIILGTFYGVFAGRIQGGRLAVMVKRVLAILLLIPAIYYGSLLISKGADSHVSLEGGVQWLFDAEEAGKMAGESQKPIMVDFYANWCPPCKILDKEVFGDQKVIEKSKLLVNLHIDATSDTAKVDKITRAYDVIGLPTVVFLSSDGRVLNELTLVGSNITVDKMLWAMEEALQKK